MTDTAQPGGFSVSSVGELAVVTPPAEIDADNCADFTQALGSARSQGSTMVVDLSGNVFCDSSGIGALVAASRLARAAGGEVRLVMADSAVLRVFKRTGADRVFRIFGSLSEAIAALPGSVT